MTVSPRGKGVLFSLPVLIILGCELIVECCGSPAHPVGRRGTAVLSQATVREVQHGVTLIRLQVRGRDQARDGYGLFL